MTFDMIWKKRIWSFSGGLIAVEKATYFCVILTCKTCSLRFLSGTHASASRRERLSSCAGWDIVTKIPPDTSFYLRWVHRKTERQLMSFRVSHWRMCWSAVTELYPDTCATGALARCWYRTWSECCFLDVRIEKSPSWIKEGITTYYFLMILGLNRKRLNTNTGLLQPLDIFVCPSGVLVKAHRECSTSHCLNADALCADLL